MNNASYTSDALPLTSNLQKMIETRFVGPEVMINLRDTCSQLYYNTRFAGISLHSSAQHNIILLYNIIILHVD